VPAERRATYRLQLRPGFGFLEAARLAPYLAALGVSHLYSSPVLQAVPGSPHGYDVVDHSRVSEELGGEAGRRQLAAALAENGLSLLLDIVPNHMAIHVRNLWWWDVLENGPSSRYAGYFDVDWDAPEAKRHNTMLLPVLGDHYGRVLEAGELTLHRHGGSFVVRYHDQAWPVAPRSADGLLAAAAGRAGSEELAYLAEGFGRLPVARVDDRRGFHRRHRDKEVLRRLLEQALRGHPDLAAAVDAEVAATNRDPDRLHAVLEGQNYRLAFWRTAAQDLGYRRFFDVNSLVGLRAEDEGVFAETHVLVLDWLRLGAVDGVRVDHPDGLRDPQDYFRRLREAAPAAWIVAEKILAGDERLRASWPVDGTTGYDFSSRALGLFVDPRGRAPLGALFQAFTGVADDWPAHAAEKKRQALRDVLGSDLNRLTALLVDVGERHRRHRDYTRLELEDVLVEVTAALSVYRTYLRAEEGAAGGEDRRRIEAAVAKARAARPDIDPELFAFVASVLMLEVRGELEDELALRFQQTSGPATAKGVEDTALYTFTRFLALNEVGADPDRFGVAPGEFHAWCAETQRDHPFTLLATATHDTKRGEDVRARLALLSEMPEAWAEEARRWWGLGAPHRDPRVGGDAALFFYQTLVGAWPLGVERAQETMRKAAREARVHSSWTRPDEAYETALLDFVARSLGDPEFGAAVERFVAPLVAPGRVNALAQALLKLTAPGVPDIYQGGELWDLSLVDPDNRRPVDFDTRLLLLEELDGATPEQVMARADLGLPKFWLIRQALHLRRRLPAVFGPGDAGRYTPLAAEGARAGHVVAFMRGASVIAAAPRLVLALARAGWGDTRLTLPGGAWTNELTGEVLAGTVRLDALLERFPVALLRAR